MDVRFLICGDCALSVQLGDEISRAVNGRVLALERSLTEASIAGISEMVPTYAALMVHYRPEEIRYEALVEAIRAQLGSLQAVKQTKKIVKEVPILYGGELGPDLELCAELEGTTTEEIIRKHSAHDYYVYMLGFAPGHPYSARFAEPFSFKRRETARVMIPARSVVVQQNLSDLIPFDQPCGWNIIGTTPVLACDYRRENPFLLKAGQWIRHIPIDRDEYFDIKRRVELSEYVCRTYEKEGTP